MKVLLDTNFVLAVLNYKRDVLEEIKDLFDEKVEFYFLKEALSELGNVKKFRFKKIKEWMEKRGVKIIEAGIPGKLDDKILFFAKKNGMAIATLDKRLRKYALSEGILVITMTKGGRLTIVE